MLSNKLFKSHIIQITLCILFIDCGLCMTIHIMNIFYFLLSFYSKQFKSPSLFNSTGILRMFYRCRFTRHFSYLFKNVILSALFGSPNRDVSFSLLVGALVSFYSLHLYMSTVPVTLFVYLSYNNYYSTLNVPHVRRMALA